MGVPGEAAGVADTDAKRTEADAQAEAEAGASSDHGFDTFFRRRRFSRTLFARDAVSTPPRPPPPQPTPVFPFSAAKATITAHEHHAHHDHVLHDARIVCRMRPRNGAGRSTSIAFHR